MPQTRLQLTLIQKGLVLVLVPLLFELALLSTLGYLYQEAESEGAAVERSKAIIVKTKELQQLYYDVGYAFLAFDAKSNDFFQHHLDKLVSEIPKHTSDLRELVASNRAHLNIVATVESESRPALAWVKTNEQKSKDGEKLNTLEALEKRGNLVQIVRQLDHIISEERSFQRSRPEAKRMKKLLVACIWSGIPASILIALILMSVFNKSTASRLNRLMFNSERLGKGQELAPPLDGKDEIALLDGAFHQAADALHESARRERAVIDYAVDVICSIDESGKFKRISPAVQEKWGFDSTELVGKNWLEIVLEDDRERCEKWVTSLKDAEGSGEIENRVMRKDDSIVDMQWTAHWSQNERSLFCVVHDVTERHELDRLKQQFVAMISHDLRTPLHAVQSTLALLARNAWGELNETGQVKISRAEDNLRHSVELINNLLDLEKMESGTMSMDKVNLLLVPLIERCVDTVLPLAEPRGISIVTPDADIEINADDRRLSQVLINLLGNALKFTPDGSTITIGCEEAEAEVVVSVKDEGPGISEAKKDSVFQRFYQIKSADQKHKQGTGLGLAICKAIVEGHGGRIGLDSVEGHGCTFWFSLPK